MPGGTITEITEAVQGESRRRHRGFHVALRGLPWLLAAALALGGLRVLAQGPNPADPPAPPAPPGSAPNGWLLLAGSLASGAFAVGHAWVTSAAAAERRRADAAENEVKEMVGRLEELSTELKAVEKERDLWMRRAYSRGFQSSDAIPVRKDPP